MEIADIIYNKRIIDNIKDKDLTKVQICFLPTIIVEEDSEYSYLKNRENIGKCTILII